MKYNTEIQKKQKKLIRSLSHIGPVIEGSLSTVQRICGNPRCQCRTNPAKKLKKQIREVSDFHKKLLRSK